MSYSRTKKKSIVNKYDENICIFLYRYGGLCRPLSIQETFLVLNLLCCNRIYILPRVRVLYKLVLDYKHVLPHQHDALQECVKLRITHHSAESLRFSSDGDVLKCTYRSRDEEQVVRVKGASVLLLWDRRLPTGCAQVEYKAWSCRNHETVSVGGKQTESPSNSS